jgi:uncharacterized protein YqeY
MLCKAHLRNKDTDKKNTVMALFSTFQQQQQKNKVNQFEKSNLHTIVPSRCGTGV